MLAATDHVALDALVPAFIARVTPVAPFVSSETRIFSIDCAVRAQSDQAKSNALETSTPVVSNILAGKSVKPVQLRQAELKFVPFDKFNGGNDVRLEQSRQVDRKLVPADISIGGNDVRLVQPRQALLKVSPFDVSISGKLYCSPNAVMLSRLEHKYQVWRKFVTFDVLISGNDVRLVQDCQACLILSTADVSILPTVVKLSQPLNA